MVRRWEATTMDLPPLAHQTSSAPLDPFFSLSSLLSHLMHQTSSAIRPVPSASKYTRNNSCTVPRRVPRGLKPERRSRGGHLTPEIAAGPHLTSQQDATRDSVGPTKDASTVCLVNCKSHIFKGLSDKNG